MRGPLSILAAVVILSGCNRRAADGDDISKPVDTVASAKPSASVAPVVVAVTNARCQNGSLLVAFDPPDDASVGGGDAGGDGGPGLGLSGIGGLGLTGTGGLGEGIGLGEIGTGSGGGFGFGSSTKTNPLKLEGQTLSVEGLPREDAENFVCAGYPSFMPCFDAAATSANDLDGTLGLTWMIDDDGHGSAKAIGGTLDDAKLTTCVTEAAGKLVLSPPPSQITIIKYAFKAHRDRKKKQAKLSEKGATVTGRLPPEVIKRIARANFARFRYCYELELKKDPTLKGTVVTKVVIDTAGSVASAKNDGGTMGNVAVQACVTKVFASLSFPEPEGGKVMVTYPLDFENED